MADHLQHDAHDHAHAAGCGHVAVRHGDHTDYAHDGHLHHLHDGHVDEHALDGAVSGHDEVAHGDAHVHAEGCGHPAVPHADHVDYLVDGALHHPHGEHCDAHGTVAA